MSHTTRLLGGLALPLLLCLSGCGSKDGGASPSAKAAPSNSLLKLAMSVKGGRIDAEGIVRDAESIIGAKEFPAQFADISPMQGNSSASAQELVEAIGQSASKLAAGGKTVDARKMCLASVQITKAVSDQGAAIIAAKAPAEPTEEAKALRTTNLHAFKIWCMTSIVAELQALKIANSVQYAQDALNAEKSRSEQLETLIASKDYKRILSDFSGPTKIDAALGTIEQAVR